MKRRVLLAGTAVGMLGGAGAARGADPARVAVVFSGTPATNANFLAAFRRGLARLGLTEGASIVLEVHYLDGDFARLPALAEAIVRRAPRVIAASPTATVAGLRRATATIPIVIGTGADPVGAGLAASLARPGGNVTGLSSQGVELVEKQLAVLREVLPAARRVLMVRGPAETAPSFGTMMEMFGRTAARLGLAEDAIELRGPADFARVRTAILERRPDALFAVTDPIVNTHRVELIALGNELGVPTIGSFRVFAEAGGLASYGVDQAANWERAAWYVDRILKGANPAELPIEQPTRFELIINMKTAHALGLTIPPMALAAADEVIE